MFLYYFSHISRPMHDVMACLSGNPERWLPGDLAAACEDAAAMTAPSNRLSPGASGPIEVAVGPVGGRPGTAVCPIRVEALTAGMPFAHLDADLELSEIGAGRTQLTLRGSYQAPMAPFLDFDPGLLHRLAEAAMKSFVERVAARLSDEGECGTAPQSGFPGTMTSGQGA